MRSIAWIPLVAVVLAGCMTSPGSSTVGTNSVGTTGTGTPGTAAGTLSITATSSNGAFTFSVAGQSGVSYMWYFGDLTPPATGTVVHHTYNVAEGTFSVLVVGTANGQVSYGGYQATVGRGGNTIPIIKFSLTNNQIKTGVAFPVDGSASADPDGDSLTTQWILAAAGDVPAGMAMTGNGSGSMGGMSMSMPGMDMSGMPGMGSTSGPSLPDTGLIAVGGSASATYPNAGLYQIHCHPHPWMVADIFTDANATTSSADVLITKYSFLPPIVHIKPGGKVTYHDVDEVQHDAMAAAYVPTGQVLPLTALSGSLTIATPGSYTLIMSVTDGKAHLATAYQTITVMDNPAPPVQTFKFNGTFGPIASTTLPGPLTSKPENQSFTLGSPAVVAVNTTSTGSNGAPNYGTLRFRIYRGSTIMFEGAQMHGALPAGSYTFSVDTNSTAVANTDWTATVAATLSFLSTQPPVDEHGF
ncbi:MAG: hypothetical protein ACYDDF_10565 [Thermoplasmatota archaeon]